MPKIELKAEDVTPAEGPTLERMSYKDYRRFKHKLERKPMGLKGDRDKPSKQAQDPFPDKLEIGEERVKRHDKGAADIDPEAMRSAFHTKKFKEKRKKLIERAEKTARAEILNKEEEGYLEADNGEVTWTIQQREIKSATDLASAAKCFDLHLPQFGPYHIDYTDNGRHLLIGGRKGHVASLDWQTKKLHCEHNVMEKVQDISWMHTESIYAVAQKNYLYVYDNQGTELHCVKEFGDVCRLEFLPRHFLLVGGARNSFLRYLDVSIGKMLVAFPTKTGGPLDVLCQNPANAIIYTGHSDGTVQLWSPNVNECLVKMLAHPAPVKGVAIDESGTYMATTGLDRKCRIWDVRMYRQLHAYSMPFGVGKVSISQRKMIACAIGNTVQIFKDMHLGVCHEPYLVHECKGVVTDMQFVPYEDVLGVGHTQGFTSMLVPGCGEANVDALRSNPYETKSQRREREVRQLLDKLQPDLIALDPDEITRVNESLLEREMEERKKLLYVRPITVQYTPRHKMKGRGKGRHKEMRKNVVKEAIRSEHKQKRNEVFREIFKEEKESGGEEAETQSQPPKKKKHVLDRFKQ